MTDHRMLPKIRFGPIRLLGPVRGLPPLCSPRFDSGLGVAALGHGSLALQKRNVEQLTSG